MRQIIRLQTYKLLENKILSPKPSKARLRTKIPVKNLRLVYTRRFFKKKESFLLLKANDVDNRGRQFLFLPVAYARVKDGKENVGDDHSGKHKGGNKHTVCKDEVDVFL